METMKKVGEEFFCKVDTDRDFFGVTDGWKARYVEERTGVITEISNPFTELVSYAEDNGLTITVLGGSYVAVPSLYVDNVASMRNGMVLTDVGGNSNTVLSAEVLSAKQLMLRTGITRTVRHGDLLKQVVAYLTLTQDAPIGSTSIHVSDASAVAEGDIYETLTRNYTVLSINGNIVEVDPPVATQVNAGEQLFLREVHLTLRAIYVPGDTLIQVQDVLWTPVGLQIQDVDSNVYVVQSVSSTTRRIILDPPLVAQRQSGNTFTRVPISLTLNGTHLSEGTTISFNEDINRLVPGIVLVDPFANQYIVQSVNTAIRTVQITVPLIQGYTTGDSFYVAPLSLVLEDRPFLPEDTAIVVSDARSVIPGMKFESLAGNKYEVLNVLNNNRIILATGLLETLHNGSTLFYDDVITTSVLGGSYSSGNIVFCFSPVDFVSGMKIKSPTDDVYTIDSVSDMIIGKVTFADAITGVYAGGTVLRQTGTSLFLAEQALARTRIVKVVTALGVVRGSVYMDTNDNYHYVVAVDTSVNPNIVTMKTKLLANIPQNSELKQVGNTGVYKVPVTINVPGSYTVIISNPEIGMQNVAMSIDVVLQDMNDLHQKLDDIRDIMGSGIDDQIRFYKGFI